ncbi:MAG: ABC transporter permease subunit [Roseibium album]|uniref:ABC transporter permease subunit n=1 Tax=Roseibium album TaxID=311410 RepID=UPI0032EC1C26
MSKTPDVGRMSARRVWSDRITKHVIGMGGAAVIGAITLIFAYLLWVVGPIFFPGSMSENAQYNVAARTPVLVDISDNGEVTVRISQQGIVEFYDAQVGRPLAAYALNKSIVRAQRVYPEVNLYALLETNGTVSFVGTEFRVNFVDGQRVLTPKLNFPFSNSSIALDGADLLDVTLFDGELKVLSANQGDSRYAVARFDNVEIGYPLGTPRQTTIETDAPVQQLLSGPRNELTFVFDGQGGLRVDNNTGVAQGRTQLAAGSPGHLISPLLGRYSILIAKDETLTQWGLFKDATGFQLKPMRQFDVPGKVIQILPEPRRKGFVSVSEQGHLALHYPTTGSTIDVLKTDLNGQLVAAVSPRSDLLVVAPDNASIRSFELHNEHPEISFATLWQEVWYEGYEEPLYSWQSSSADTDFEPKFSLTPLAFGTLKAAFYALLFAVPIAIMGAIYTAYFMSPSMRAWVKPGIEIMAALPTVILGFIGGLWLAPIIESYLSSVLSIFFFLPLILFSFAVIWSQLSDKFTRRFTGWYALLVTPIIVGTVYAAFGLGPFFEEQLFGGDSKAWFREVLGLSYDQRNALVVGIIMGLAVIPTIFSIAEDAIYGVPTHLINGSLALGATPWQTLTRVVLLTASPGIFSAVMIGMGRAVGETMIVLMATGNTPLMDFNIFEGMRTFAANIAVELPESEVGSSHYRILFLAALVLFMLTFMFNTLAEVVRQRLRNQYGSL